MTKITTHALDIVRGGPAAGMRVVLRRVDNWTLLADVLLNADGRADSALVANEAMIPGVHELEFFVGEYFKSRGVDSPFLEVVPVRFTVSTGESYHVPLVCSPWAYQTYRGS